MKKIITAALSALLMVSPVSAFAEGTFLYMKADDSVAITADENNELKYITMTASNGQVVYPQISTDGNTYLPFRYICEMAGLKDGADASGELPDGYFRYWPPNPDIPNDTAKIEINCNGNYYCHSVGEKFEYEVKPGDIRTVSIYNIRGSLYFPMAYMAKITNSEALWRGETENIIYVSNSINKDDFLDGTAIRRDKELALGYNFYYNNLGNSSLYLKSTGSKIQSLSEEIEGNPKVTSVSRRGSTVYFVDENNQVQTKPEYDAQITPVTFKNQQGEEVSVLADTALVVRNKIYGIQIANVGEKHGRLFESNLDGSDFRYITERKVYNLIAKPFKHNWYLFFCDANTKANLYMTELKTMDTYDVQITDFGRNNLLENISKFVIGESLAAYISEDGKLHVIDLVDNLEEFEIIRTHSENHKIFLKGSDGESLNNITSINYDNINNVLYVSQVDYTGKTYYYTRTNGDFNRLERSDHSITDIALFSDIWYNDICAKIISGQPQINKIQYSNGRVSITE